MEKFRYKALLVSGLVFAPILPNSVSSAGVVAVIEVHYRRAEAWAPVLKPMLSTDETITVSDRVNSLLADFYHKGRIPNCPAFQVI